MKAKYLIMSIAMLSVTVGCTDLNVDIKSQYTSFPDNDRAIEAKAASAYYYMRGPIGRNYNQAQTLSSDEATTFSFNGSDYYDQGQRIHFALHSWNADDALIGYYDDATAGITACNKLITELGGADADATASLRAMRAYYHWVLMDSYGDTPILDHSLGENEAVDRSPRADVAKWIESELLAVVDKLPDNVDASTYGKPTRWMAEALLAKLYLNWAVYTCGDVTKYTPTMPNEKLNACVKMCDDIIASKKFDLSDDFLKKFYPDNGYQIKDFIYAMPFDPDIDPGMTYARFWTHRSGNKTFYGVDLPNSVGGCIAMNPEFVDKYNLKGDERNESFVGGPLFVRDPSTYKATTTPWMIDGKQVTLTKTITLDKLDETMPVDNTAHGGRSQGYRSIKFYMDLSLTKSQERRQGNDVPIFRYADILLEKAEAIMRGATATNGDTPASLMNQIRAYVHAPSVVGTPTLDDLLDERAREFADENWRRNDLIRFGKFEDDWGYKHIINPSAKTQLFRRIFPIPTATLKTNTNWKQNPEY
ncbi:MAG TPA: RagB/SusD family nutrient uptake outer membrane protein [Prevotella sp.]|nr:RagB/SusD family nutrient uptake outer membrane protein [Prevotella sp.]